MEYLENVLLLSLIIREGRLLITPSAYLQRAMALSDEVDQLVSWSCVWFPQETFTRRLK